jgi:hypothetical protein
MSNNSEYPILKFNSNGDLIYLEQLIYWVKDKGGYRFNQTPIKVWFKRNYNENRDLIEHEDSLGNYWSKESTPDIEYPYLSTLI